MHDFQHSPLGLSRTAGNQVLIIPSPSNPFSNKGLDNAFVKQSLALIAPHLPHDHEQSGGLRRCAQPAAPPCGPCTMTMLPCYHLGGPSALFV
jgi:hypothetical protein